MALYRGDADALEVAVLASGLAGPVSATGVQWHRWDPDAALLDAHAHPYAADEMYDTPRIRRSAIVATPLAQFWSADHVLRTYGWSPPEGAAPVLGAGPDLVARHEVGVGCDDLHIASGR